MTALLEFKQKIKGFYAKYEMYLQPLMKFVLALIYFIWINSNMGYMTALDNMFVVLILALIYSAICNDYICRICYDGGSQLCSGNRCCGIHACSDSFYDDRISQIQYRAEYCCGFDTACLCI